MAEPERKFEEIEPDIRPHFDVIAGGGKKSPRKSNLEAVKKQESNPGIPKTNESLSNQEEKGSNVVQGPWKNKVSGAAKSTVKPSGRLAIAKKKGPLTAIILTLAGGGLGITALLSPSLLIVQVKEIMVNKFNTQLSSMDIRTNKLLAKKTLSGGCGSVLTIACKYSTMSKKQIEKFEKAGIKVKYTEKNLFGRAKPTSFEFGNEKILAKDFNKTLRKKPEFRVAVKKAYNPKFAGFADSLWNKAAAKLGVTKTKTKITGDTDAERLKSVQEQTKNPQSMESASKKVKAGVDEDPKTKKPYTQEGADAFNKAAREAGEEIDSFGKAAAKTGSKGIKVAPEILAGVTTAANSLKVTGWVDNACVAYNAIRAVGFAAKTVRAVQLARYAMIFLNVADQIKAGEAKTEDVAYLGKILTTEVAATATTMKLGSATSSFGYRYAAYGDTKGMTSLSSQFLAGGGLTGDLIRVTSLINQVTGGNAKRVCGTLNNPFVAAGSLVAGIGLMLIPGVNVAIGAKNIAQMAAGAALITATFFLPGLLQDIVAGVLVDKDTVGEAAGEAITSGSSGIMSTAANTGGNAPLTPPQAVAYTNMSNDIAAQYAEEERLTHSPFDASNSNTFIGKIVGQLIPYAANMSSLSGTFSSISSMVTGSFASLTPKTAYAASTDDYKMCQDYDYRDLNLATDPYCNVMYGIPPDALNADPITVANALQGQIDPESGDPIAGSKYATFVENCIDRKRPLGDSGADSTESDGKECLFGKKFEGTSNDNYYIHYIDQRVQAGLDGEEVASSQSVDDTDTNPPSGTEQPTGTVKSGKGWTLKPGYDYSNVACAVGTKDNGIYTHPLHKFKIRLCKSQFDDSFSAAKGSGRYGVASILSQNVVNMLKEAKDDGLNIRGTGFRSYEEQQSLWAPCASYGCNGMVAQPGNSNHERGIALDVRVNGQLICYGGSSKADCAGESGEQVRIFNWLVQHGPSLGLYKLSIEAWHFSANGG